MSDITFKVNNPLKIKSGTGVSISSDGKSFDEKGFDGQQKADIRISIPQEVGTNSNVAFTKLQSLKPDRDYLRKSFVHTGSFINSTTSSFNAITASAPSNLSTTNENDFMFFINGMLVENNALTINQKTSTNLELRLDSSELGYTLEVSDEIIGFGKFNS